ncbi:MAG: HlyD family efflux transporter periplasmic adaptor subunit [Muribaculaceae bacterium]|nr:HlyD family efflux transporter periplasmic adaptor subunit [Muribaculaceae bacterium]
MDREVSKDYLKQQKRKRLIRIAAIGGTAVIVIALAIILMRTGVKTEDLKLSTAERGTIETTVSASGRVAPAFEEIINSPISTKIVEVYRRAGDSVSEGTPLLQLDLLSAETELKRIQDERDMKRLELDKQRLNNNTFLTNLDMQIRVNQMAVNRLSAEVINEQRLDSLGSGTGDKVREVKLAYETARLELEQLRKQLVNERSVRQADEKMKELELSIFDRNLAETMRTFEDAQIKSPRRATLTYINDRIGHQISQGERVAVIADLSHFKINGEIADSYGDRVAIGARTVVRVGKESLPGIISNVTPLSNNGVIAFTVELEQDDYPRLRSGLKTDVYVMCDVHDDVIRIANGPYYRGPGLYDMFVRTSDSEVEKRKVKLGDSNYEYVEVLDGVKAGEEVVTADMSEYREKNRLKLR